MATARETIGDALGSAYRAIKARLQTEFLAARGPLKASTPLTPAEVSALMAKIWNAMGRALTPISPDGSVTIGTQNDINGDPQLTLRATQSSVVLTSVSPFALYQFWRGETYGGKDGSGNQLDLSAYSGGATYADLLSYGQGAKFAGGYLQNSDTSGKFQDLGDMSAFLSFQLDAFPAEGDTSLLFAIDGEGAGDYNCLFNAYLGHTGAIGTGHEVGGTWYGYSPAGTVLELGRMYTLGVVRTSTGVSVYLDGVLLGTGTMPAAGGGSLSTLLVGGVSWGDGTRLSGSIASLALFHGALSSDDMKLLHRNEVFRWGSRPGGGGAPTAHASTHAAGQSDALSVTEGMLSLADNTTADASSTKHGLLPKLPNDATRYLDGSGAWSVPYTSAFTTAYSVDFTALASQNLLTGGNGNKTIDGKTWVLANSAGLQTAYLQDGSHAGLYLKTAANTNNANTDLSAGVLYVPLSTLASVLAQYQQHREIWIWLAFSLPHTPAENYSTMQMGLFGGTPYTAAGINRVSTMVTYANGPLYYGHTHLVLSGTQTSGGGTSSGTCNMFAMRILDGNVVETYYGTMSGSSWPAKSALTRGIRTIFGTTGIRSRDNWYLSLSVYSASASTLQDALFSKLLVEYK